MRLGLSQSIALCRKRQKQNFSLCISKDFYEQKNLQEKMSNKLASQIERAIWFFLVYKTESSVARVNVLCESYYGMAYKLQRDVVAVQISWQNANLSLLLKKLMRWYIVAEWCYMQWYAGFSGFSLSV